MDLSVAGCVAVGRKKKMQEKEEVECCSRNCVDCKQANVCGSKVFCGWMRKFVDEPLDDGIKIVVCPRFEVEPLEYRVYRRT